MVCLLYSVCCGEFVIYNVFLFFKQKTAYEMRISDWSSDVCSSDLHLHLLPGHADLQLVHGSLVQQVALVDRLLVEDAATRDGDGDNGEIGRASCRERVCPYV